MLLEAAPVCFVISTALRTRRVRVLTAIVLAASSILAFLFKACTGGSSCEGEAPGEDVAATAEEQSAEPAEPEGAGDASFENARLNLAGSPKERSQR